MRKATHMVLGGLRFLVLVGIGAGVLALAVGGFFFSIQGNDPWLWVLETLRPRRAFAAVRIAAGAAFVVNPMSCR